MAEQKIPNRPYVSGDGWCWVYIARHGQNKNAAIWLKNKYNDESNEPMVPNDQDVLSYQGIVQVKDLASTLVNSLSRPPFSNKTVRTLFSPSPRAKQTHKVLVHNLQQNNITVLDSSERLALTEMRSFEYNPATSVSVQNHITEFLQIIHTAMDPDVPILIVSHGNITRMALSRLCGFPSHVQWGPGIASLTSLQINRRTGQIVIHGLGETSHSLNTFTWNPDDLFAKKGT